MSNSDASKMYETSCYVCKKSDFTEDFGPRCILLCDGCSNEFHVGCLKDKVDVSVLKEDVDWFCSDDCKKLAADIKALLGKRSKLEENYSLELVRYTSGDRVSETAVATALKIFQSSFDPLTLEDGSDLIESVCKAKVSDDDEGHDFSKFHIVLLRQGAITVCAATIRFFGRHYVEVPFVATKLGFRRGGNCRRLITAFQGTLQKLQVKELILPSVNVLVKMWEVHFGFQRLSKSEYSAIEDRIICPDPSSSTMLRKSMMAAPAPQPRSRVRVRPPKSSQKREADAAAVRRKKSRGLVPETSVSVSSSVTELGEKRKQPELKSWTQWASSEDCSYMALLQPPDKFSREHTLLQGLVQHHKEEMKARDEILEQKENEISGLRSLIARLSRTSADPASSVDVDVKLSHESGDGGAGLE